MELNQGLWLDASETNQPQGTWKYLLNGVFDVDRDTITDEDGFRKFSKNLPSSSLIGAVTGDDEIILFLTDNSSVHEIGILNKNGYYRKIVSSSLFNFNENFPIKAKFIKNFNSERIVTFVDQNNTPKIFNLDNIIYSIDTSSVITGTSDLNNYLLFPEHLEPKITNLFVGKGGSLLTGTYFISVQYETEYGITTAWNNISCPFYVSGSSLEEEYGSESNQLSSKSLIFTLEDVDTRFSKINIVIFSIIEGISSVTLNKTINLTSSTTITNINISNNNGTVLTLEEVLSPKTQYIRIKDIEVTEDEFLGANVIEEEEINFQQYANMIEINYTSEDRKVETISSSYEPQNVGTEKGFRSGEVYSFYCSLVLNKGGESRLFHIPGRAPVGTEHTDLSQYRTGGANDAGLPSATKLFKVEDTSNNGSGTTNMGYWENDDEEYPDTDEYDSSGIGGLDLKGEKVRHHRFPSLKKLYSLSADQTNFGVGELPLLSITVDNLIINSDIADKIIGVKIYYAKRDIENMTCLGQSLFQTGARGEFITPSPTDDESSLFATIGNFRTKLAQPRYAIPSSVDRLRFYDFALMNSKPSISPTYISNQVILDALITSAASSVRGDFMDADNTATFEFRRLSLNFTTTGSGVTVVSSSPTDAQYIAGVLDYNYIPTNIIVGGINNLGGDEHIDISLSKALPSLPSTASEIFDQTLANFNENAAITDLNQLKDNVYYGLNEDREVVCCHSTSNGQYISVSGASTIDGSNLFNGDNFVDAHGVKRHGQIAPDIQTVIDPNDLLAYRGFGATAFKIFAHESIQNVRFRYSSSDSQTQYYPNIINDGFTLQTLLKSNLMFEESPILYSKDFTEVNSDNITILFDSENEITSKHPFRIIRSDKIGREDQNLVLTFPPLSYYEMSKKRGKIVGINTIRDKLVIRHEQGTYITRPKQKITTDAGDATIGSNDLFDIEPQEILTTEQGVIKSKGVFDALPTEKGLIIVDSQEGKIFSIDQGGQSVQELTGRDSGVSSFFLEQLKNLKDVEIGTLYLSASVTITKYLANYWQFAISSSSAPSINFTKGEFIWIAGESTFAKILKVYVLGSETIIETDWSRSTIAGSDIVHYRKIDSPLYNTGVILGWDKDSYSLFLTVKNRNTLAESDENRFIGKSIGNALFGDDLNEGDIVERRVLASLDKDFWVESGGSLTPLYSGEDRDFTISFNVDKGKWVSFHSYIPNLYLNQHDRILSFEEVSKEIYKHHQKDRKGQYYNEVREDFQINVIFNNPIEKASKKFSALSWVVNFVNSSNVVDNTKTFDNIQCSNSYDDLGQTTLVPFVNISSRGNVRNIIGTWHFNTLKNSQNELLTDKYLLVVFKDSDENSLYLYDVSSSFKLLDRQ